MKLLQLKAPRRPYVLLCVMFSAGVMCLGHKKGKKWSLGHKERGGKEVSDIGI